MVLADGGTPRGLVHGASRTTASEPVAVRDFLVALYYWLEIGFDEQLLAPGTRRRCSRQGQGVRIPAY